MGTLLDNEKERDSTASFPRLQMIHTSYAPAPLCVYRRSHDWFCLVVIFASKGQLPGRAWKFYNHFKLSLQSSSWASDHQERNFCVCCIKGSPHLPSFLSERLAFGWWQVQVPHLHLLGLSQTGKWLPIPSSLPEIPEKVCMQTKWPRVLGVSSSKSQSIRGKRKEGKSTLSWNHGTRHHPIVRGTLSISPW